MFTSDAMAATVYFKNIKDISSFQFLVSASVSALFDIARCIPRYCCLMLEIFWGFLLNDRSSVANLQICECCFQAKFGKLYKFPKNVG